MVDVNIVLAGFTIRFLKVHIAHAALTAVMIYTFISCCFAPFVFVNFDLLNSPFIKGFGHIIWIVDI
jgi:nitrate reductase NapE component